MMPKSETTSALQPLGELELAVMDYFWDHGESDVKEAHAAIGETRGVTLNTVQSTVKRLYEKGILRRHKVSHAFRYEATMSRPQFQARVLRDVAKVLGHGKPSAVMSAFVTIAEESGRDELERLEVLVAARLAALSAAEGGKS